MNKKSETFKKPIENPSLIVKIVFVALVLALAISLVGITLQTIRYENLKKRYNNERLVSYALLRQAKEMENYTVDRSRLTEATAGEQSITILVPPDINEYQKQMAEYTQTGANNPLEKIDFVERKASIPYTFDVAKAIAALAAAQIPLSGGPELARLEYFKLVDGTAYVLFNIHTDSWAGVSVARGQVEPVVERSLLRLDSIDEVVFENAPEDRS